MGRAEKLRLSLTGLLARDEWTEERCLVEQSEEDSSYGENGWH